ncbi:MAG: extracellular solute-binding protein [Clostridiaceae bacterium]|nr:extracellular solute-binding protein [Clostridiaceae bacterium]
MATLKDIANLAGVSQATVSNVLNGRGNVSSKKVKLVEAAALKLGYTPNDRAKFLRKGSSNILALVMPNTRSKRYNDVYTSFKNCAERNGYTVSLYLTDDLPNRELALISKLRSDMVAGVAAISCLEEPSTKYCDVGFVNNELLFIERGFELENNYIGFDYEEAGYAIGTYALDRYSTLYVITEKPVFYNNKKFIEGFSRAQKEHPNSSCKFVEAGLIQPEKDMIMYWASESLSGGICTESFELANALQSISASFLPELSNTDIVTLSPLHTLPHNTHKKYELDYRRLGNYAAQRLIFQLKNPTEKQSAEILENSGFRNWDPIISRQNAPTTINLLMLNGPEAIAVQKLSRIYSERTGVSVAVSVYSYDEIYEILNGTGVEAFDILRIDITFLSWFAQKLLVPLSELDSNIHEMLPNFLDGVSLRYSTIAGKIYAIPFSPSYQLLFYRKDLFESTVLRRLYFEKYKCELTPPTTFKEFNQIARFFTKHLNPNSPVQYGASLTLGSIGVAASEFMARLLESRKNLYNDSGKVILNDEDGLRALQQIIDLKECAPSNTSWWTDTAEDFANEKLAMAILYSNYASNLLMDATAISTKIGYALVPGENPVLGGASLGIAKTSKNKEIALDLIKWLCSDTISSAATLLGGVSPCKTAYKNYELMDTFPWMELSSKCFAMANGYRQPPENNLPFNERQFLNIIGMAVKNAYNGVWQPSEALNWAQNEFDRHFTL